MGMIVGCPFCGSNLPFRRDKRGGRFFRCNLCQFAFLISGQSVIDRLEAGGTWSFTIARDTAPPEKPDDFVDDLFPGLLDR